MPEPVKPSIHVSIIGCGDIGCRVAKLLLNNDSFSRRQITGFSRNNVSLKQMRSIGIGAEALDLDNINATPQGAFKQHSVFYFAPPPPEGSTDTRIRKWLDTLNKQHLPQRILYISTTGVYGDHQGALINEHTPPNPQTYRAKRRFDAETALCEFADKNNIEFIILRVSGIYGKHRLPVKRLQNKTPVLEPALSPITNRIHEDDLAQICVAAAFKSANGEIFNVADGDNMTMTDYFLRVAEYLNIPLPPTINWQEAEQTLSAGMLSYLKESRLIDSSKLFNYLGVKLKYPSLHDFFNYNKH